MYSSSPNCTENRAISVLKDMIKMKISHDLWHVWKMLSGG
jgi:hypothetical protein